MPYTPPPIQTSAQLAAQLSDETGTGANVFATSPSLVTPILGTPTSGTLTNCTGGGGYTMQGGSSVTLAPADGTTYFFGDCSGAALPAHLTIGNCQMVIPKTGTITRVHWHIFVTTNGTNESVTHILRLNNTTDTTLSSSETYDPGASTQKTFTYTGLSIAVTAGDTIVFKMVCPTWTTNPTLASTDLLVWIN